MDEISTATRPAQGNARAVQAYIDELPVWADGTKLKSAPMTGMQWRIWSLAAAGKFFEGFVVFMGGVTVPLITLQFHIAPAEKGLVTSASLAGTLVGRAYDQFREHPQRLARPPGARRLRLPGRGRDVRHRHRGPGLRRRPAVRSTGAGFAAMIAKVGAVVTWLFRIETTGVNLDRIGRDAR